MTNSEKYLKDEMKINDFISDYIVYCFRQKQDSVNLESLALFLKSEVKLILTEDEKVILRNICFTPLKDFYIERKYGTLKLHNRVDELYDFFAYDHLFQFIKEGEEYSIEELLKGE